MSDENNKVDQSTEEQQQAESAVQPQQDPAEIEQLDSAEDQSDERDDLAEEQLDSAEDQSDERDDLAEEQLDSAEDQPDERDDLALESSGDAAPAESEGLQDGGPSTVEVLTEIVIDSAETAHEAARNANASSELVINSVAAFNETMGRVQKRQYIMFWCFLVFMLVAVSVSGVLMERFTQSALQADEIMLTVGKRIVQLDADIKRVENLRKSLDQLTKVNSELNKQVETALATMSQFEKNAKGREEAGIKRAGDQIERIANRVELKFDKLAKQTQTLDDRVKASEVRFAATGDELAELRVVIKQLQDSGLTKKVDSLINLQKQRNAQPAAPSPTPPVSKRDPQTGESADESEAECKPVLGFPC